MTYAEYRDESQQKMNDLPIFYAFSDKQFEQAMTERGLSVNDTDKLYRLGGTGGFYLKTDADKIHDYFSTYSNKKLRQIMESDLEFAREAFEYECFNHEYGINWQGDWDVISCFGGVEYAEDKTGVDYLRELGMSDAVIGVWRGVKNQMDRREW